MLNGDWVCVCRGSSSSFFLSYGFPYFFWVLSSFYGFSFSGVCTSFFFLYSGFFLLFLGFLFLGFVLSSGFFLLFLGLYFFLLCFLKSSVKDSRSMWHKCVQLNK